jgi:hypothetical protein
MSIKNHAYLEPTERTEVMEWPCEREHTRIDAASKNRHDLVTN